MAIVLMKEPRKDSLDINDWDRLVLRTTYQGSGFICIEVDNINNGEKPKVKMGGSFHFVNVFYNVERGDEDISGTPTAGVENFVYAVGASDGKVSLQFSKDPPTWNAAFGGWYNDATRRALVKFFYVDGKYNNKVILDSYNAMSMVNTKQVFDSPEGSGGVPVGINGYTANKPGDYTVILDLGVYRYELRGGNSGAGGTGGTGGNGGAMGSTFSNLTSITGPTGEAGEAMKIAAEITGIFVWHGGPIKVKVGANGGNGGNGGKGGNGKGSPDNSSKGYSGSRGGAGGGGGGGLDSCIGEITAPGAPPTMGGNNNAAATKDYGYLQIAAPGSVGVGAPGTAGEGSQTNYNYANEVGKPGSLGSPASTNTSGYARLWRLG